MGFCLFHVSVNCVDSTGWKVLILSRVHFLNDWDIIDCMALDVHDRWLCLKQLPLLMWSMLRTRLEFAIEFKGITCLSRRVYHNHLYNTNYAILIPYANIEHREPTFVQSEASMGTFVQKCVKRGVLFELAKRYCNFYVKRVLLKLIDTERPTFSRKTYLYRRYPLVIQNTMFLKCSFACSMLL